MRRNFLKGKTTYKGDIKVRVMSLCHLLIGVHFFVHLTFSLHRFGAGEVVAHRLQHLCDMFSVISEQDSQNWKQKTVDRACTSKTVVSIRVVTVIQIDNQEMNSGCKTF